MSKKPRHVGAAPLCADGRIADHPGRGSRAIAVVPVEPVRATMVLDGVERGRSAARFRVESTCGARSGVVFMSDMMNILTEYGWPKDGRSGLWGVCKRGQNYGLFMMEDGDE